MKKSPFIIDIDENSRVTYINQQAGIFWKEWKNPKDCTKEELAQVNLATPHPKYIVIDMDFGDKEIDVLKEYEKTKDKLISHNIEKWIADKSRNGFHIFIPTTNLAEQTEDIQKEIRTIFIDYFDGDFHKKSSFTAISLPGRPHFKTNTICGIIEEKEGPEYTIRDSMLNVAKSRVEEREQIIHKLEIDKDFANYFESDAFWAYLKTNIIPDNSGRDFTIFPNLAIASVKSGKSKEEIKNIIKPVIEKNFPGKSYAEFEGWLKKAYAGEITTYNFYQINTWMKTFANFTDDLYATKVEIEENLEEAMSKELPVKSRGMFKFYLDSELDQLENRETEWLCEKWIAKGDICFVAGKSASFKTTLMTSLSYAIATGGLFLNKYKCLLKNVLYLNEENSVGIMSSIIQRVKKGLQLHDKKLITIGFGMIENIRFDNIAHLVFLADYLKKQKYNVLVLDSLRRFIGFDENNATEMNKFFNYLKILRKECDLTIIILHHLKKDYGKGGDIRDMLRGSSDIVNSADNIIGLARKKGSHMLTMEHIKNRNAEEIENKLIIMDTGEQEDMAYFYESEKELDKLGAISVNDKCAEEIHSWIEDTGVTAFSKKNLPEEIIQKYSGSTISRTLKDMVDDDLLGHVGKGPNSTYTISQLRPKKNKQEDLSFI